MSTFVIVAGSVVSAGLLVWAVYRCLAAGWARDLAVLARNERMRNR